MSIPAKLLLGFVFVVSVSFAASPRWSLGGSLPYFHSHRAVASSIDFGYQKGRSFLGVDFLRGDYRGILYDQRLTAETLMWRFHLPAGRGLRPVDGYAGVGIGMAGVRNYHFYTSGDRACPDSSADN
jgi:hypothetical protein